MDGVLSDFSKGVEKYFPDAFKERDYIPSEELWPLLSTKIDPVGLIFYELDFMPDARELWQHIDLYNPEILSATGGSTPYGGDLYKKRWISENLCSITKVNIVDSSEDKGALFAKPNRILIDDSPRAIEPWIKAGGIGILHTSAEDTIKQLKAIGL